MSDVPFVLTVEDLIPPMGRILLNSTPVAFATRTSFFRGTAMVGGVTLVTRRFHDDHLLGRMVYVNGNGWYYIERRDRVEDAIEQLLGDALRIALGRL